MVRLHCYGGRHVLCYFRYSDRRKLNAGYSSCAGLALIDTIVVTRPPKHVESIVAQLQAGSREMTSFVGLPLDRFNGQPLGPIDPATQEMIKPPVERAAATMSFNDAWLMLAVLVGLTLLALPWMKLARPSGHATQKSDSPL